MNFTDLAAIVGAAAWLPNLFLWLKPIIVKTKLEIIKHNKFEIGYNTLGPIININLAISATNNDVVINNIVLTLTHENLEVQKFNWMWFEESLFVIDIPDAGPIDYKKNQNAIALKVLTDNLVEKKVGFQQKMYHQNYNILFSKVNKTAINYIETKKDIKDLESTNDYIELKELLKNNFIWKSGKYKGKIDVIVSNEKKKFTSNLEFELTTLDIKILEANILTSHEYIKNIFIVEDPNYKANWKFINTLNITNEKREDL